MASTLIAIGAYPFGQGCCLGSYLRLLESRFLESVSLLQYLQLDRLLRRLEIKRPLVPGAVLAFGLAFGFKYEVFGWWGSVFNLHASVNICQ